MEEGRKYHKYDREFKLEAVRLVAREGEQLPTLQEVLMFTRTFCAGGRTSFQMTLSGVFPARGA